MGVGVDCCLPLASYSRCFEIHLVFFIFIVIKSFASSLSSWLTSDLNLVLNPITVFTVPKLATVVENKANRAFGHSKVTQGFLRESQICRHVARPIVQPHRQSVLIFSNFTQTNSALIQQIQHCNPARDICAHNQHSISPLSETYNIV